MEFGLRRAVSICGLAVLGVVSFCPVHAQVVGWRGDGTGRYLDVTPPFKWGRVATSILQLRGQAARPGDGETGQPIPHGSLREWMVLGPCPVPKGLTDFDGEVLEGEADFSPAVGDVTAEMEWEKVTLRTATLDFRAILGDSVMEAEADPSAAYACGWLHSEAGGDVALTAMTGAADLKMWVNGEPPEFGPYRSVMTLEPGWNRILIRSVSSPGADHGSWYVRPLFYGAVGSEYETDNIAWATRMPAPGVGSPIVVGDKVFVTADTCNLLCVDKLTGQILWVRSATYLDAGTDAERAAAPEVFAKIDPWADRLAEINQDLASAAATAEDFRKEKAELETRIHREMKKVDSERYSLPHAGEAGMAPMTPVSDGEHVWVLFATCTLACYDLEGNLVWAALETGTPGEHGHTSSPLLIDGKIITYIGEWMGAFDAATGEMIWQTPTRPPDGSVTYYTYHGTACRAMAGTTECVFTPHGMVVRVSDGTPLLFDFFGLGRGKYSSPVSEDGVVHKIGPSPEMQLLSIELQEPDGDVVEPAPVRKTSMDGGVYPRFYLGFYTASPLVHDGLIYCVDSDGVLTVVDAETREVAYQEFLDADISRMHNWGASRGGLGSSPALAGGYIYLFGNQGTSLVIRPGREFEVVARSRIEQVAEPDSWRKHQEVTMTSPTFDGDRLYIRGDVNLYCIRQD